ncbi:MAG TPA: rhomboid family intramembrane serine protease [Vicinamibacterales bacterium]|nr:rhomboid family intramembrane serine protease [Vicinamibacterales bacterium]
MGYVFLLAIALVIVMRSTTAAERRKYLLKVLKSVDKVLFRVQIWWREIEPFRETLRARTRIAPVTPLIVVANLAVVAGMIFHPQLMNDPDPMISWGANFGPRTANGEWWRLITTLFVHVSVLDLMVCLLAFVPLGLILERIVGPAAFAAVYLTAGLFSSLFMLSAFPVAVSAGAAGAVAGVYAFMLAVLLWGISQRPRLVLPLITIKLLAICGGLFVAYSWLTGAAAVVVVGFASGLFAGLTVSRGVNTRRTPTIRMAATVATMACVAIVTAVPLKGITDARREIEIVLETETQTAQAFKAALQDFTDGRMTDKALAVVIDRVILPELDYVSGRLAKVDRNMVPREQAPMITAAEEYLTLRNESWTLRANALRSGKMSILWIADKKEALSLEALRRVKSGTSPAGNP